MAEEEVSSHKKKARRVGGVVIFEDEASFQVDPTLHRTWARRGAQPRIPTRGERRTAHVYGAIALDDARFTYEFTDVFNGASFLGFLKRLVARYPEQKIFLIVDNAPGHNLNAEGKEWLRNNRDRIELHRLPPYSPEFNPTEGVWKTTRRAATHNKYFESPQERDRSLIKTFRAFQRKPSLIEANVRRFR